jgi:hypothetical protein
LGILVQQNWFFISSSFMAEASDWVQKFNDEKHYMPYINKG